MHHFMLSCRIAILGWTARLLCRLAAWLRVMKAECLATRRCLDVQRFALAHGWRPNERRRP